jgi:acetylornithine/succinyldiaminopimelate/putrescine aminotransferase/predicted amino acid dehydrogenase/acyl carrier protein
VADRKSASEIEGWLRAYVQHQLGVAPERVRRDEDLASLGIDSLEAVTLVGYLERWIGEPLPPTLLWDCASIGEFVDTVASDPAAVRARTSGAASPDVAQHPYRTYVNPFLGRRLAQLRLDKRFVRGEGSYVYDAEGRRYLDFVAQYGALPFGYNPPEIWAALDRARSSGLPSFVQPSLLDGAGELARRLVALAPRGLRYVTFTNSGTESIEVALKLCRNATGRPGILSTDLGFHGKTLAALSASGKREYQEPFGLPFADFQRVPFGDVRALESALRARPGYYAAFVVEPVQGEGGITVPPADYLPAVQALCREAGVRVIADEVQTGLGRTGTLFASQAFGLEPDVMTLAKALGGGLIPVGACLCTAEVYSERFGLKHSSTFAGNALAMQAALATLDLLERDDQALVRSVAENGAYLRERLLALQARFPELVSEVRGLGFMLGIRLAPLRSRWAESFLGVASEQGELTALFASYLLNVEGVRLAPTLNRGDVLRIEPPLNATREQCDQVVTAIERGLQVLSNGDTGRLYGSILDAAPRPATLHRPRPRTAIPHAVSDARFAFLLHPLDAKSFVDYDASLASLSPDELDELVESFDGTVDPFVGSEIRVVSKDGAEAFGRFVVIPRTAEGLLRMGPDAALEELRRGLEVAAAGGAQIVGLGAYTSILSRGGLKLADAGVPLTSGNSFTVVSGFDALTLAAARLSLELESATAAVLGGAGSIGRGIGALLAERVERLILIGNPDREEQASRRQLLDAAAGICRHVCIEARRRHGFPPGSIAHRLMRRGALPPADAPAAAFRTLAEQLEADGGRLVITRAPEVLPLADVVVTATSSPKAVLSAENLKMRALVCDLSRPRGAPAELRVQRPDVVVFDGGLIELPGRPRVGPYGLTRGLAYACMAETMLLALERRFENTSLGPELSMDEIRAQRRLAQKHGFTVAEPQSWGVPLSDADWMGARRMRIGERAS